MNKKTVDIGPSIQESLENGSVIEDNFQLFKRHAIAEGATTEAAQVLRDAFFCGATHAFGIAKVIGEVGDAAAAKSIIDELKRYEQEVRSRAKREEREEKLS